MSDIIRFRGDTTVIQRTIKNDAGAVLNIAGWTLWLTINAEARPSDVTNEMAQMSGTVTDAPNGVVEFQPTADQVDYVGVFFFDIQAIDASGVKSTLNHARFIFLQDITKLDETFVWTPPTDPDDGDVAVLDGSIDLYTVSNSFPETGSSDRDLITYETRDSQRVIRSLVSPYNAFAFDMHWPVGPAFNRRSFPFGGWEFRLTAYIDRAAANLYWFGNDGITFFRSTLDIRDGTPSVECACWITDPDTGGSIKTTPEVPMIPIGGPNDWDNQMWYEMAVRFALDGTITWAIHPNEMSADGYTDVWLYVDADSDRNKISPIHYPLRPAIPAMVREHPENPASFYDLWKYEWRRLT